LADDCLAVIFVVDDDPRILRLTSEALIAEGHSVTAFSDGSVALAALKDGTPPHVLITDVLMPVMSGPTLARAAHAALPTLRILFMSGDIGETPHADFGGWEVLPKPFTSAALCAALARALAR
jgi:two-component system, cell cycle sensor histidine kinase and response regulator CckA